MIPIEKYFLGEKLQCSIGIGIAIVFISLALYLFWQFKPAFYKGMAYPFLFIPLLLFIICTGVVIRTSQDIQRVNYYALHQPEKINTEEIPRMKKVMQNFKTIKTVEICLSIAALCLFLFAANRPLLKGIGFGLLIQSIMMYGFDYFAESRGKIYWDFLQTL